MTQMIHWMLAKMDSKTIEDYKTNPVEVVDKLIRNHHEQNNNIPDQEATSEEMVADLPQSS